MGSCSDLKSLHGGFIHDLKLLPRVVSDRESLVGHLREFLLFCEIKFRGFLNLLLITLFEICVLEGYEVMLQEFMLAVFQVLCLAAQRP